MIFSVTDNATDSLDYALDFYSKYIEGHKNWDIDDFDREYFSFLKLSVLFIHHTAELLMKKALSDINELLICENLSDNIILDIYAFKVKNNSKTRVINHILGENCNIKTIDYKTLVNRFSRIFSLSEDLSVALNYLGKYRNKIAHLGIEMPLEYYKIISSINGSLKVISDTIYNIKDLTINTGDPIYEIYEYIEDIIELGQSVEEELWSEYYFDNFRILNSYLDDLLNDLDFQNYLTRNSYGINIEKGNYIDSNNFSIIFNNTKENASFTIYIKNKPFSDISIFHDEEGYVFSVLDQKKFLEKDHKCKCFYSYKIPVYPTDNEFEECKFWVDDRSENRCNLYEFNYLNLVNCLKRAVEFYLIKLEE